MILDAMIRTSRPAAICAIALLAETVGGYSSETRLPNSSQGTCFAVSPDGLVLTAFHVIDGATDIEVTFPGKGKAKGLLVRSSSTNDLALIRVPVETKTFLPLGARRSAAVGDRVFTIGFPYPEL